MDIKDWRMDVGTFSRNTSSGSTVNPLPAVDTYDNGKVLGVVSGVWNKMDVPSTGGDVVIAKVTQQLHYEELDKCFNDIVGKVCYVKYETRNENTADTYYLVTSLVDWNGAVEIQDASGASWTADDRTSHLTSGEGS